LENLIPRNVILELSGNGILLRFSESSRSSSRTHATPQIRRSEDRRPLHVECLAADGVLDCHLNVMSAAMTLVEGDPAVSFSRKTGIPRSPKAGVALRQSL
jgi:hypothetical protein